MKAVVLAGGLGSRMRPLTDHTPKPLLPYRGGQSLLERLLEGIAHAGCFTSAIVVNGYLGHQIEERIGPCFGSLPIKHVRQPTQLGTYDALVRARSDLLGEHFLVVTADDVRDPAGLRKASTHRHAVIAANVHRAGKDPREFGVIEKRGSRLLRIIEKPAEPRSDLVSTGAIVTDSTIFSSRYAPKASPSGELQLPDAVALMIDAGVEFSVVETQWWVPISTADDLHALHRSFRGDI